MDWLNENALRSYPFVDGTPLDAYPGAIVDAVFALGADIPFDFGEDTAEIRLTTVTVDGAGHHLQFQYFAHGVSSGPSLVFLVPPGSQKHRVFRAGTALSHGYITIGNIQALPSGAYNAPVETRTLTRILGAAATQINIFNTDRRKSLVPYIPVGPGLTPAQRYAQAKAQAPTWAPNMCLEAAVASVSGVAAVTPGFSAAVNAEESSNTVVLSMDLNASGSGCSLPGYVESRLGTNDPVADINGDGIVTQADVTAAKTLAAAPQEITVQGVLRSINGVPADRGNLVLSAGSGMDLATSQDQYAIMITLQELRLPASCR